MAQLRIAVWHNLPSGGGKRALYDHIQGLVARGHYVESWCPPTADQEFLPIGELVNEHVVALDPVERTGSKAIALRLSGGGTLGFLRDYGLWIATVDVVPKR